MLHSALSKESWLSLRITSVGLVLRSLQQQEPLPGVGDEELRGAILAFAGYREFEFDSVLGTEEKGSTANVH